MKLPITILQIFAVQYKPTGSRNLSQGVEVCRLRQYLPSGNFVTDRYHDKRSQISIMQQVVQSTLINVEQKIGHQRMMSYYTMEYVHSTVNVFDGKLCIHIQGVLALCYFWDLEKNRISQKSHQQNFHFMYALTK